MTTGYVMIALNPCPFCGGKARKNRQIRILCNQLHRAEEALKMVDDLKEGKDTAHFYDVPFT